MKNRFSLVASIFLDVVGLVVGYAVTFLAIWADYEGTLSQFWFFRLGLETTLVLLVGGISLALPEEGTVHKWVRFALMEVLTIQLLVEFVVRQGAGPTSFHNSLLPLLVDGAVYWGVLNVRHLFVRPPGHNGISR